MEKGNLDKILSKIKGIEKKNVEFQKYLSSIDILSRDNILKEISIDIIKNNKQFKELHGEINGKSIDKEDIDNICDTSYIDDLILKIQKNPSKKIIILREFFQKIEGISENDKSVILQSLNDDKCKIEELKEKIASLVNIFKLKI